MPTSAGRLLALLGVAIAAFGIAAVTLVSLMADPRSPGDYLIVGCLSTLVALAVVFVVVIATSGDRNPFFKRRPR